MFREKVAQAFTSKPDSCDGEGCVWRGRRPGVSSCDGVYIKEMGQLRDNDGRLYALCMCHGSKDWPDQVVVARTNINIILLKVGLNGIQFYLLADQPLVPNRTAARQPRTKENLPNSLRQQRRLLDSKQAHFPSPQPGQRADTLCQS